MHENVLFLHIVFTIDPFTCLISFYMIGQSVNFYKSSLKCLHVYVLILHIVFTIAPFTSLLIPFFIIGQSVIFTKVVYCV